MVARTTYLAFSLPVVEGVAPVYDMQGLPWMECAICHDGAPPALLIHIPTGGWNAFCADCRYVLLKAADEKLKEKAVEDAD